MGKPENFLLFAVLHANNSNTREPTKLFTAFSCPESNYHFAVVKDSNFFLSKLSKLLPRFMLHCKAGCAHWLVKARGSVPHSLPLLDTFCSPPTTRRLSYEWWLTCLKTQACWLHSSRVSAVDLPTLVDIALLASFRCRALHCLTVQHTLECVDSVFPRGSMFFVLLEGSQSAKVKWQIGIFLKPRSPEIFTAHSKSSFLVHELISVNNIFCKLESFYWPFWFVLA